MIDMANAQRHHEWMIRGVVPGRYIVGPAPREERMADPPPPALHRLRRRRAGHPGAARRPRPRRRPAPRAGARPRRGGRRPDGRPVRPALRLPGAHGMGGGARLPRRRRRGGCRRRHRGTACPRPVRAPFGLVAAQVGISDAMAERKGTEAARLDALRALSASPTARTSATSSARRSSPAPRPRWRTTSSPRPGGVCSGWTGARGRRSTCRASSSTSSSRWSRWTSRPPSRWSARDRAARPEPSHAGLRRVPRRGGHHRRPPTRWPRTSSRRRCLRSASGWPRRAPAQVTCRR